MARRTSTAVILGAAAAAAVAEGTSAARPDVRAMWQDFKARFGRAYADEKARFEIFRTNMELVHATNARGLTYQLGVNQFADLTASEFADEYTGLAPPPKPWGELPHLGSDMGTDEDVADEVDWTKHGVVTPAKNQGQCGSCWSFSTTGALEGAWAIATGKLRSLSEQQFVDCDKVDQGCNGGLMDSAFKFAKTHALCSEDSYSYEGRRGTCQEDSCIVAIPKGSVAGFRDVARDSAKALMQALMQQPVSIAIEADKSIFQLYRSGVLKGACGSTLDHGVLAVGYGTERGVDYWTVKNSWGKSWGEHGFVRLFRGEPGAGECGLLSGPPSYPVVKASNDDAPIINV